MRNGQISLFIIVGLMLLIAVGVLIMAQSALTPSTPKPPVDGLRLEARACLAQTTQAALAALADDGVITSDEGGPLENNRTTTHYLLANPNPTTPDLTSDPQYVMGVANHWGLCDRNGPNAIGRINGTRYPCGQDLYAWQRMSIQEQLETTINQQMNECLNTTGHATVVIQDRALVTLWDDPEVQHAEPARLMTAWRAIKEMVEQETLNATASPDDGLACCENAAVQNGTEHGAYDILVSGERVTTIHLENRNIGVEYPDGKVRERPVHGDACDEWCTLWSYDEDPITASLVETTGGEDAPEIRLERLTHSSWNLSWEAGCEEQTANVTLVDNNGYQTRITGITVTGTGCEA